MLTYIKGDILDSTEDVIVIPVNCKGVMRAGLAKQFKNKYPEDYIQYKTLSNMQAGSAACLRSYYSDQRVMFAATKNDWRNPSQLHWIEAICLGIRNKVNWLELNSVALPLLGCGLGGLSWKDQVKPLYEKYFTNLKKQFIVYEWE